ncbi:Adaptive-response sensory-kinase SasA [Cellulomonas sp. T2.31MG-18]|uniref:sensor histidine kinase n=1 Tax=Cellulomonas sp. T2.31MG-18 TaxID=3157619 RepID=UPI0035E57C2E
MNVVQVALVAVSWSAGVVLAGVVAAALLRRASLRWSTAVVALVSVGGVAAGVLGTAHAMFLSQHDLHVVITVCVVSGLVSVAVALWLGERLVASARRLRDAATRFGDGGRFEAPSAGPRELTDVAGELSRSAERLHEADERERRLERSRRELVAWVSHDLRSPLAGIRAMSEALEDGLAPDPARYRAQMRTEVDRMVRMVDDLFELSRIHAGTLQLAPQTVQLADVVSEAIAAADPVARAKGVRVGGAVAGDVLVRADPDALARVVANLVMNAVRHTPSDGSVVITGQADGPTVTVAVADACGGIPADDLGRVFDVGWRGGSARTPDPDAGAGLGLAIVRGLVEAHHGRVAVQNQAPGCRFVVTIPA